MIIEIKVKLKLTKAIETVISTDCFFFISCDVNEKKVFVYDGVYAIFRNVIKKVSSD